MNKVNQAPLFDAYAAQYVIGGLMHQPSLLYLEDKYILTVDDFDEKLYTIIFGAVYNLSFQGAEKITPNNIDLYLTAYQNQYQYYSDQDGITLLNYLYELTEEFDIGQFNLYYDRLKKFSVLRELRRKGFNINEFYNPNLLNSEDEEIKFNQLSIQDILGRIRNKIQLVENQNLAKQDARGQYAAKGIRTLLKNLSQEPEIGLPIEGTILNYATRGCRKGKMYMYSSNSGGGKSRTMVGNACSIAFPRIENGKIVISDYLHPVLYIATEQQADEIQTMILAYISGVDEEKILMNTCSDDEIRLLNIAASIMEKYEKNFVIEMIPNPSVQSLKSMITNYILKEDIEYIFYDYIFTSAGLMSEFSGVGLREDVVLMLLSNTLKEIAATYNVFLMTGTQLNGSWEGKTIRNANMIRGAKSIVDKVDVAMIGIRCPDEELQQVRTYCEESKLPLPNIVIDIYKNRRGKMCNVKIFRNFNYGTCRTRDILITTTGYEILTDIPTLECEVERINLEDYE